MPGRLRRVLADSGVDLSDEELLDILWLAERLPQDREAPLTRAVRHSVPPPSTFPEDPVPSAEDEAISPTPPSSSPSKRGARKYGEPLHAAAIPGASGPGAQDRPGPRALPVRAPGAKSLEAHELRLGRALRPLKRWLPDHGKQELDEARTVTAMAETGLPDVVLRASPTRWLALALLVDDSVSMLPWQRLASEVRALMERTGAFRSLRVYGLDSRSPQGPILRRPYEGNGVPLPPAMLNDPAGNTLILVVSDGVGSAWRDGRMWATLGAWARQGPTAIVHALPARLWQGSGIRAQQWQVTTRRRGGPSSTWQVSDPVLPPDLVAFEGDPVPVLEPEPAALGTWARVVASPGTTAVLPLLADGGAQPSRPYAATRQTDMQEAVLRFRHAASPEAYRLAAHLAAVAPVSVPVMHLVQAALGPPTDTGHLAEVFLGGLMQRAELAGPTWPAGHGFFDFPEEARRILLGTVPGHELLRTTRAIADRLGQLSGRSPGFPAWLSHTQGPDHLSDGSRPFGWLDSRLMTRLGVRPPATQPEAEPEPGLQKRSTGQHMSLPEPAGQGDALRFSILGPVQAWRSGTPLDLGPPRRQAVLTALLLRQGAVVGHQQLLDSVWGAQPPASGPKVLSSYINPLRRALDTAGIQPTESVIRSGKGWYRFVVEGVRLDTADLAHLSDEAMRTRASGDLATAADQLSAAIGLFRGEPLAGLPGPFAQDERARLLERRRSLRREWLECLVLLHRFGEVLDDIGGTPASEYERYDESILALRMRALYGRQRQAEALKVYEEMRVRLRDELGVDPGEELRRVHEAVLRQDDAFLLRQAAASPVRPRALAESARAP